MNATNTLLSAFDIQELRVRDIEAAVPSLLTGADPNCAGATALLTQACTTDLVNAVGSTNTSQNSLFSQLQNLNKVATTLNTFSGQLTDRVANPTSLVNSLFAPNGSNGCAVAALTDCDFKYTTYIKYGTNGLPTVDEYTCKKVPNLGAGFLHLSASNQTFYAIGHTRETLSPVGLSYSTQSLGPLLASTSSLFPSLTSTNLVGSLAGLNAQSYYYVPQTVAPDPNATPAALSTVCP